VVLGESSLVDVLTYVGGFMHFVTGNSWRIFDTAAEEILAFSVRLRQVAGGRTIGVQVSCAFRCGYLLSYVTVYFLVGRLVIQSTSQSAASLPVAHTCFNVLDMPENYTSKEQLEQRLLTALDNYTGFALV
jgi:hypothetical protein